MPPNHGPADSVCCTGTWSLSDPKAANRGATSKTGETYPSVCVSVYMPVCPEVCIDFSLLLFIPSVTEPVTEILQTYYTSRNTNKLDLKY